MSLPTAYTLPAVLLVYTSERLNRVLGQHWQSFAGQPYFDKNGIFISAVLSAPLVLDMLVILVGYLENQSSISTNTFSPWLLACSLTSVRGGVIDSVCVCWPAGLLSAQSEQDAGSNETAGAQAQSQAGSKSATSTRK